MKGIWKFPVDGGHKKNSDEGGVDSVASQTTCSSVLSPG